MSLDQIPRAHFCHLPTPLEPLPRLSAHLGGPDIYVKRDDATGLALGGNKARKLEFLIADALAADADTLITMGAPQSNHCRQTAAAAARYGLACHVVLVDRVTFPDRNLYLGSGNMLLDHMAGAQVHIVPGDSDQEAEFAWVAEEVRASGHRPYIVPIGGSNALGTLGYVVAGHELTDQAAAAGIAVDAVFVTAGSGATQAGLMVGLGDAVPVVGICIGDPPSVLKPEIARLATEAAELIGVPRTYTDADVDLRDSYIGPAYGQPTEGMVEALRLCASLEGLILDPVYTGKAMAGLIDLIRGGAYGKGQSVVFMHTGGTPSLFVYHETFAATQ